MMEKYSKPMVTVDQGLAEGVQKTDVAITVFR